MHRYPDRVLLKLTHVCPVYCRFCFRREMVGPGKPNALSPEALARALDYIRGTYGNLGSDPHRRRSAGVVAAAAARGDGTRLRAIEHVKVVRIHTRVPVVDPARVTPELVARDESERQGDLCRGARQSCARIDGRSARGVFARMADAGMPLLVADGVAEGRERYAGDVRRVDARARRVRVKPYYLHHADLAPGTAHLRTDIADRPAS